MMMWSKPSMGMMGIFILSVLLCVGCISLRHGNPQAFDGVSPSYPSATRQVAEDMAWRLASAFPPGRTKFSVDTDSAFGDALDRALRQSGFQLSPDGIPLSYSVDMLSGMETPAFYANILFPDGASISQIYSISGGLAVPSGNIVKTGLPDSVLQPTRPPVSPVPAPRAAASYTLEASPDRLTLGQAGTVLFFVRRDGQPVAKGFKPHFEATPSIPNLRPVTRLLDQNGVITVKGLKPVTPGPVPLRLVLDRNTSVETILTVMDGSAQASAPLPAPMPLPLPLPAPVPPASVAAPLPPPAPVPAGPKPALPPVPAGRIAAVKPDVPAAPPSPAPVPASPKPALPPVPASQGAAVKSVPPPHPTPTAGGPPAPAVKTAPAPTASKPAIVATDLPAPKSVAPPAPEWIIHAGLLRRQLESWAGKSGYQLIWKARHDFDMDADVIFRGEFIDVVKQLFISMHEQGNLLRATIYQDNHVLEVTEE